MTPEQRALAVLPADPQPTIAYLRRVWSWFTPQWRYEHDIYNEAIGRRFEHWRSLLPVLIRNAEAGELVVIDDDCDAPVCTMLDIAMLVGFRGEDALAVRVRSPEARRDRTFDHLVGWIREGQDSPWWAFDIWSVHTQRDPYRPGSIDDPGHQPVDVQAMPFRPGGWRVLTN